MCVYNWTLKKQSCPICRAEIKQLNYYRRKTQLSIEIKKKSFESICHICKYVKKTDYNTYSKGRFASCECGMYFHYTCDTLTNKKINFTNGRVKCYECTIFEQEMHSIDKVNQQDECLEYLDKLERLERIQNGNNK